MKALLIDDERLARNELRRLLAPFSDIVIVDEATNAEQATTMRMLVLVFSVSAGLPLIASSSHRPVEDAGTDLDDGHHVKQHGQDSQDNGECHGPRAPRLLLLFGKFDPVHAQATRPMSFGASASTSNAVKMTNR